MDRLLVIDGSFWMHSTYYATEPMLARKHSDRTTDEYLRLIPRNQKGLYSSAIKEAFRRFMNLTYLSQTSHVVVVWDAPSTNFRKMVYADYKGTRKPTSPALKQQIETFKNLLAVLGVAQLEIDGVEADDIAGSIACKFKDQFTEIILVSNDQDYLQLITDNVSVLRQLTVTQKQQWSAVCPCRAIGNANHYLVDISNFRYHYELDRPQKMVDYKAIAGDVSDNIKGVTGVGDKSAILLLKLYNDLEEILNGLNDDKVQVEEKWKQGGIRKGTFELMRKGADAAMLSKFLAQIKTDVEFKGSKDDMEFNPRIDAACEHAENIGFKNFTYQAMG